MDPIRKAYKQMLTEDSSEYTVVPLTDKNHIKQALDLGVNEFAPHAGGNKSMVRSLLSQHDPEMSRAVLHKGKVVGAYFLKHGNVPAVSDQYQHHFDADIKGKRGVEGVGLVIHPDHRGHGVGTQLKNYTQSLNADYVWGGQLKSLNNIHHWLKRRKVIYENPYMHITYQSINQK